MVSSVSGKKRITVIATAAALAMVGGAGAYLWFGESDDRPQPRGSLAAFEYSASGTAPDFTFTNDAGEDTTLAAFEGKVVLFNLWATWCAPCVHEMPALDHLEAMLGGEDFQVVALSIDRGGAEDVDPFFEELGLNHLGRFYDPSGQAMGALNPRGLPTTYLYDRAGRQVGIMEGAADWDASYAVELIEHVIDPEA